MKVAYALEDMRIRPAVGEAWMRLDDHQLFEPLFIMVADMVNGRDVKYDMEGTGIGLRTEARIEPGDMLLPTRCKMVRPAQASGLAIDLLPPHPGPLPLAGAREHMR